MTYRQPPAVYTCDRCSVETITDEQEKPPKTWRRVTTNSYQYSLGRNSLSPVLHYEDTKTYDICADCMKSLAGWLAIERIDNV